MVIKACTEISFNLFHSHPCEPMDFNALTLLDAVSPVHFICLEHCVGPKLSIHYTRIISTIQTVSPRVDGPSSVTMLTEDDNLLPIKC